VHHLVLAVGRARLSIDVTALSSRTVGLEVETHRICDSFCAVAVEYTPPQRSGAICRRDEYDLSLIRRDGGVVALGSDWPVVPFDPFRALNSAVNRQTVEGHPPGGWLASEKLSLPDALAAYSHGSAYAAHAEHRRGTIKAGMDADLIVLDRDILAGGPASIIGTKVALTVVGGEIVHATEDVA
jgi:predicted amidohydrolase YtcJ